MHVHCLRCTWATSFVFKQRKESGKIMSLSQRNSYFFVCRRSGWNGRGGGKELRVCFSQQSKVICPLWWRRLPWIASLRSGENIYIIINERGEKGEQWGEGRRVIFNQQSNVIFLFYPGNDDDFNARLIWAENRRPSSNWEVRRGEKGGSEEECLAFFN